MHWGIPANGGQNDANVPWMPDAALLDIPGNRGYGKKSLVFLPALGIGDPDQAVLGGPFDPDIHRDSGRAELVFRIWYLLSRDRVEAWIRRCVYAGERAGGEGGVPVRRSWIMLRL